MGRRSIQPGFSRKLRPGARRGSVYVLALMISLVVTAMGVGAALAAQSELAAAQMRVQSVQTRIAAQSALELGLARAQNTAAWRSSANAATPGFVSTTLGGVSMVVQVDDGAGAAPSSDTTKPVRFRATASIGAARHGLQGTFMPGFVPPASLSAVAYAGGNISFLSTATLKSSDTIGSNGSVTAVAATVQPAVYAAGAITGLTFSGGTSSGRARLALPDSSLVDKYVARGTAIAYASVSPRLQNCLLAPVSNPFGAVNASGIYVINCAGAPITVSDLRVYGTLVLLDPGAGSLIEKSVAFEPVNAGEPCLVVRGSIELSTDADDFKDSPGKNYNPVGAPYLGVTDASTTTSFASVLHGIVYATGNIVITKNVTMEGVLVAGGDVTFGVAAATSMRRVLGGTVASEFQVFDRWDLDSSTFERVTY